MKKNNNKRVEDILKKYESFKCTCGGYPECICDNTKKNPHIFFRNECVKAILEYASLVSKDKDEIIEKLNETISVIQDQFDRAIEKLYSKQSKISEQEDLMKRMTEVCLGVGTFMTNKLLNTELKKLAYKVLNDYNNRNK